MLLWAAGVCSLIGYIIEIARDGKEAKPDNVLFFSPSDFFENST